jgi:hypothetical protein
VTQVVWPGRQWRGDLLRDQGIEPVPERAAELPANAKFSLELEFVSSAGREVPANAKFSLELEFGARNAVGNSG